MKEHKQKDWYNSGRYPTRRGNIKTKACQLWENMKQRSTEMGKDYLVNRQKSYRATSCCDEWKDYSNFYEWFETQQKEGKYQEGWELDKEVLKRGNECYSPKYCCFIPKALNCILTSPKGESSTGYRGVSCRKGRYEAFVTISPSKYKKIGGFLTKEEAFLCYAVHKKKYILEVLDKYRSELSSEIAAGIENWEIVP